MTIDTLTREAAAARMEEIHERLTALSDKHRLSKADEQEFANSQAEFGDLQRHVEKLDRAAAVAACAGEGSATLRLERAMDPYAGQDAAAERLHSGQRDSAMRTLERSVKAGLPERGAEIVERLLDTGPDTERSWVSRWITETGSEHYRAAFAKLLYHGEQRAGLEFTAAERAAYDRVARLKQEQRAMSLTDSAGGFLVPFELDPTIAIVSAGSINPLLEISRVVHTVTDAWHGVSSAGVVSEWLSEASEASDASPALAEPVVNNYKASTFVPFSVELQGDAVSLLEQIGRLMSDGMTQLLNTAFTTGSGVGNPTGIITALTGTSSVVNTGTGGTLAAADVYALQSSLGPRWQANARWVANLNVFNTLRQVTSPNGNFVFPELRTVPPTLLNRPAHELSNMDAAISAGNHLLVYGDFNNYVISQRVGSAIELIPHLVGENRRPTGQRGVWMWARYGADSVNDAAFRMLAA
jgi:HK97 family phage major capsid protein